MGLCKIILENNIRIAAAILICFIICSIMHINSVKIKLLLMSLVWVRILIPLSINYNISIAPDKLPERLSQTADVNAVYGMKMNLVLAGIWLAGIIMIFFHNMLENMRLRNRLSTSIPHELAIENKRVKIYMNDYIDSAIVYGILKPKIYMSYSVDYSEIKYLYEHECMHIRHKHHIIKLIVSMAVIVNWFNPLLWMFYKRYMEYIELVCDYDCCKKHRCEENWHSEYAKVLLGLSCVSNEKKVRVLGFSNDYIIIQNRIKNIMSQQKIHIRSTVVAFLLLTFVIVILSIKPKMQIAAAVDNERLNINGSEEQVEQEDIKYDKNKTNETRKGSGGGYVQSYKEEYDEDDEVDTEIRIYVTLPIVKD